MQMHYRHGRVIRAFEKNEPKTQPHNCCRHVTVDLPGWPTGEANNVIGQLLIFKTTNAFSTHRILMLLTWERKTFSLATLVLGKRWLKNINTEPTCWTLTILLQTKELSSRLVALPQTRQYIFDSLFDHKRRRGLSPFIWQCLNMYGHI